MGLLHLAASSRSTPTLVKALTLSEQVNSRDDVGATPLIYASMKGPTDSVRLLLAAGADPNVCHKTGQSPLMLAAEHSANETVQALLEAGADPLAKKDDGWTPLMYAAKAGASGAVRLLLDAGSKVNEKNNASGVALDWAAFSGSAETIEQLLRAGAAIPAPENGGLKLLEDLKYRGTAQALELLLDAGAGNAAVRDERSGYTALISAARAGSGRAIDQLLSQGANPNDALSADSNYSHHTALMFAAESGSAHAVRSLIQAGADVHAITKSWYTPIMFAAMSGSVEVLKLLVEAGANTHTNTNQGMTPLMYAAGASSGYGKSGSSEAVEYLLSLGVDVNNRDRETINGDTAFFCAIASDTSNTVELLLGADADIYARNHNQETPLIAATRLNLPHIVELLLDLNGEDDAYPGYNLWALSEAAKIKNRDLFERLLWFLNIDPEHTIAYGTTPLMLASQVGSPKSIDLLLSVHNNVNDKKKEVWKGNTALMYAAESGSADAVRLLLQAGAVVDHQNEKGDTALVFAARSGESQPVRLLLEAGADPNTNFDSTMGSTPLSEAARHGSADSIDLLVAAGAKDIKKKRYPKQRLLANAARSGSAETVKRLIAHGVELREEVDLSRTSITDHTALAEAAKAGHAEVLEVLLSARHSSRGSLLHRSILKWFKA